MYRLSFLLLILLVSVMPAPAQTPSQPDAAGIYFNIQKLGSTGSALYIAAHPDDENTRLLSWLSKDQKVRTGYLSLTRGDGGQNLIGKEQGDELGVIRTQELMGARRIDGAEQFFTRAVDFGYSKNPEETFSHWNRDSILSDMVWVIRKFRPDVIICRFPATGEGGHGHHTASAILALEAFDAAADPAQYPWQLDFLQPWQATRIVWNTFNFGGRNTTAPDQLMVNVGGFNPLLGKHYGEIAAASRSMHKSQGFGSASFRGPQYEYFKHLKGNQAKDHLLDNVDTAWSAFPEIKSMIKAILEKYDPSVPSQSIPALIAVHKKMTTAAATNEKYRTLLLRKAEEASRIIVQASGLWIETTVSEPYGIPGDTVTLTTEAVAADYPVVISGVSWPDKDSVIKQLISPGQTLSLSHHVRVPQDAELSRPFWLENRSDHSHFFYPDLTWTGLPENPPALPVTYSLKLNGYDIMWSAPAVYRSTDPVKGDVYRPYAVIPPVTSAISGHVFLFTGNQPKEISVRLTAQKAGQEGVLKLILPSGWKAEQSSFSYKLDKKGETQIVTTSVTPGPEAREGELVAQVTTAHGSWEAAINRISYEHIPEQIIVTRASAKLIPADIKNTGLSIGYIPGAGDDIPASLAQAGIEVITIDDDMLARGELNQFDAIVLGVRAYNTNKQLLPMNDRLLEFVRSGKNLIVQYNTNNRIAPLEGNLGPFPFTITRNRVTDEKAEVIILDPGHPALNFPNKITAKDFEGWVQERGIYFADEIDPKYQVILQMNDPGESPQTGSLIIAPYGRGNFVYTGLSFFRELPAGVPGAYRLFLNLLSLPPNDEIND